MSVTLYGREMLGISGKCLCCVEDLVTDYAPVDKAMNFSVKLWILRGVNLQLHFVKGIHFITFGDKQFEGRLLRRESMSNICCFFVNKRCFPMYDLLNASEFAVLLVVLWLVSCAFTRPTDKLSKVLMPYFFFILI